MEVHETPAAIYSEAKSEYTKQLVFNFLPVLLRFFLDRYDESKKAAAVTSKTRSALSEFQDSLKQIPEWNLDKVQRETSVLLEKVNCDYIEDLITAVFIAHTKILSAINLHTKPRRGPIKITIPKPDHFMHRTISEGSRLMWSNVYLFDDSASSLDRQKNMNEVNRFLEEGILQAIRNLLPVKSILRDSLQEDGDDAIQITTGPALSEEDEAQTPKFEILEAKMEDVKEPKVEEPKVEEAKEAKETKEANPVDESNKANSVVQVSKLDESDSKEGTQPQNTFVVDTERSVGFTGVDSVFGESGDAELRPMIDEEDGEIQILGESEALDLDDIDDLNDPDGGSKKDGPPAPLSADDYEAL
jgi:hypothetical protein